VLYVGVTNDLHRTMSQHRSKVVPGFTREHGVIRLVYFEEYASITEAHGRERSLKRWRRAWKLKLIDDFTPEWRDLAEDHFVTVEFARPRICDAPRKTRCIASGAQYTNYLFSNFAGRFSMKAAIPSF
jgi:putative endonuclease